MHVVERRTVRRCGTVGVAALSLLLHAASAAAFVTFESGQVRPLALSPDGSRVFAVDTPDDRLELFAVDSVTGNLTHSGTVPVGLEPVAVAARSNTEVWVHLNPHIDYCTVPSPRVRAARACRRRSTWRSRATAARSTWRHSARAIRPGQEREKSASSARPPSKPIPSRRAPRVFFRSVPPLLKAYTSALAGGESDDCPVSGRRRHQYQDQARSHSQLPLPHACTPLRF
jgi:hypothetical protein